MSGLAVSGRAAVGPLCQGSTAKRCRGEAVSTALEALDAGRAGIGLLVSGLEETAPASAVIAIKADLSVLETRLIRRVAGLVGAASVTIIAAVARTPSIVQRVALVEWVRWRKCSRVNKLTMNSTFSLPDFDRTGRVYRAFNVRSSVPNRVDRTKPVHLKQSGDEDEPASAFYPNCLRCFVIGSPQSFDREQFFAVPLLWRGLQALVPCRPIWPTLIRSDASNAHAPPRCPSPQIGVAPGPG